LVMNSRLFVFAAAIEGSFVEHIEKSS
jgi:hypothetical protein